jgi:hypothetical protein
VTTELVKLPEPLFLYTVILQLAAPVVIATMSKRPEANMSRTASFRTLGIVLSSTVIVHVLVAGTTSFLTLPEPPVVDVAALLLLCMHKHSPVVLFKHCASS